MKPCASHIVAVLAWALAIWGRAKVPAAARASDARKTERLESLFISLPPFCARATRWRVCHPCARASVSQLPGKFNGAPPSPPVPGGAPLCRYVQKFPLPAGGGKREGARLLHLLDRVFGEDLLGPLQRLVGRLFRRHPMGHDVGPGDLEDMLGVDLGDRRAVGLVDRDRRADQRLMDVDRAMRIPGFEPERVALGDV